MKIVKLLFIIFGFSIANCASYQTVQIYNWVNSPSQIIVYLQTKNLDGSNNLLTLTPLNSSSQNTSLTPNTHLLLNSFDGSDDVANYGYNLPSQATSYLNIWVGVNGLYFESIVPFPLPTNFNIQIANAGGTGIAINTNSPNPTSTVNTNLISSTSAPSGAATPAVVIGSNCPTNTQANPTGAGCLCNTGYYSYSYADKPTPCDPVPTGFPPSLSQQCQQGGAYMDATTNTCQCPTGLSWNGVACACPIGSTKNGFASAATCIPIQSATTTPVESSNTTASNTNSSTSSSTPTQSTASASSSTEAATSTPVTTVSPAVTTSNATTTPTSTTTMPTAAQATTNADTSSGVSATSTPVDNSDNAEITLNPASTTATATTDESNTELTTPVSDTSLSTDTESQVVAKTSTAPVKKESKCYIVGNDVTKRLGLKTKNLCSKTNISTNFVKATKKAKGYCSVKLKNKPNVKVKLPIKDSQCKIANIVKWI